MQPYTLPEILAPAGSMESLLAAIHSGADAVYFGGKHLNARRNAANFAEDSAIYDAVNLCHLYGVKAYLTLNTLMFDSERQQAVDEIVLACKAGFDAIIAQDWGIISLIRQICPKMSIHASTQMSVHNLADANALYRQGVCRVVLARELSRDEIAHITANSPIETEVFVHGALCYSLSGQCYFSAFLGERSGNRGLCAQVCRLPFGLKDPNEHCLSLKDLTLIDYVDELAQLGVVSLKIEGRMKSPQYVAATVSQFKNALSKKQYDKAYLEKMFSRSGFTQGYFVSRIDSDMFGVRSKQDMAQSAALEASTAQTAEKKIPVDLSFSVSLDQVSLTLTDEDGNVACHRRQGAQRAQNHPLTTEQVCSRLSKLGNTPFVVRTIDGTVQEGCFLPVSELNDLRRGAVGLLTAQRQKRPAYPVMPLVEENTACYKNIHAPRYTATFSHLSQMTDAALQPLVYASLDLFALSKAPSSFLQKHHAKLVAEIPRVYFQDEEAISRELEVLHSRGIRIAKCHSIGRAALAKRAGFDIIFGFGINAANSTALTFLSTFAPLYTTLSAELSAKYIRALRLPSPTAVIGYGHFPLMSARACPVQGRLSCEKCNNSPSLIDRKASRFELLCKTDYVEILNSVPIYLAEKKSSFPVTFIEFLFTKEDAQQVVEILHAYENNLPSEKAFTRGTYFRVIE